MVLLAALTIGLVRTEYTINEAGNAVLVCAEVTSGEVGREITASLAATPASATCEPKTPTTKTF